MDNTINYIIDIYDDMKKIPILNYFFKKKHDESPSSTVYEISNPTVQNDSSQSDTDNRLSYIIIWINKKTMYLLLHRGNHVTHPFLKGN